MTAPVCFVDTETSGITPEHGQIWEIGLITPDDDEHHWFLPVDAGRADPIALGIGGYHDRHPLGNGHDRRPEDWGAVTSPNTFAVQFAHLTHGLHLAGAVVSFDERRLWDLLRGEGVTPSWHYHLIDVEALAVGWLAGNAAAGAEIRENDEYEAELGERYRALAAPPWNSTDLSQALGVDPDDPRFAPKHSALADARWAKAIYEAVMG